jgi:hypothetical protein
MVTVQRAVKKELEKSPFIVDLLQQELVNISALALKLQPSIERELGKTVQLAAIGMALRRATDEISAKPVFKWKFPKNIEVSTKSQIYEVAIERTPDAKKILDALYKNIHRQEGELLSFVEGTYEIVIFTNQKNKNQIKTIIRHQKITSELDGLAYISVNWGAVTKNIPGIYYRITRALAFRNIPIQSFHTIGSEMILFFKNDAFLDAYQVVTSSLHNID